MIESAIASNHYFYVLFFQALKIKTLSSIPSIFTYNSDFEIIKLKESRELDYCHLQLELKKGYGSDSILELNLSKNKKGGPFYWYDLYIGKINILDATYYYICYPYSKMGKFLQKEFEAKGIQTTFYKPELKAIVEYMQKSKSQGLLDSERKNVIGEITKYSAEVKEDFNFASRVNISGKDPLQSKTYQLLSKSEGITIETISLKLNCTKLGIGSIEISFDKLGNYRFWLKRHTNEATIRTIPSAFQYLTDIAPMKTSDFVSTNNLLENDL